MRVIHSVMIREKPSKRPRIQSRYITMYITYNDHSNRNTVVLNSHNFYFQDFILFQTDIDVFVSFAKKLSNTCYQCCFCNKLLGSKTAFGKHYMRRHTSLRPFTCSICGVGLKSKDELKHHEATHNPNIKYDCDKCDKKYKSRAGLYRHKLTHSASPKCACSYCGKSFVTWGKLCYHIRMFHQEKPQCPKCGLCYMNIVGHVKVCGQRKREPQFECEKCNKKFRSIQTLKEHDTRKHTPKTWKVMHTTLFKF